MFWGRLAFVCLYLLAPSLSFGHISDGATCAALISSSFPKQARTVPKNVAPIEDAVPDYDANSEVLISFNAQHVSLYFGGYFWHWDGAQYESRNHPRAIPSGVIFQLKVGAEVISRLETSIAQGAFTTIRHLSCQHRALALLHNNGVQLKNDFPLLGFSIFEGILNSGFMFADGRPVPMVVHAVRGNVERPRTLNSDEELKNFAKRLREHHANYFLQFGGNIGITRESFAQTLAACGISETELLELPTKLPANDAWVNLSQRQTDFLVYLMADLERKLMHMARTHYGSTKVVMMHLLQDPAGLPSLQSQPIAVAAFVSAVCEAAK